MGAPYGGTLLLKRDLTPHPGQIIPAIGSPGWDHAGSCRVIAAADQGVPTQAYYLYVKEAQRRAAVARARPEGFYPLRG